MNQMQSPTSANTGCNVWVWIKNVCWSANCATWASVIVTSVAAAVAYYQWQDLRAEGRSTAAKALYKDYLKLAFDEPEYALATYKSVESSPNRAEDLKYEKYQNYVSYMLFAVEEILDLDNSAKWEETLLAQMQYHSTYLAGKDFQESACFYSSAVLDLRARIIVEGGGERLQLRECLHTEN